MTLRDYFAAKAMQALVGSESWREAMDEYKSPSDMTAAAAYMVADAMLKARGA